MKFLFLLGAVNVLAIGAIATPSSAQVADRSVQPTCRTVLGSGDFSKLQRGAGLPCCYVTSERPWYDRTGVVVAGIYQRQDGERYVAWRCDELSANSPMAMAQNAGGELGAGNGNSPGPAHGGIGSPGVRPVPPPAAAPPAGTPISGQVGGDSGAYEPGAGPGAGTADGNGNKPHPDKGNGPGEHPDNEHPGQDKPHQDNGKGNGVDPAPGKSGDRFGDDADGANTEGTLDTSSDKGGKGKH